ncbi:putative transposase [Shigella flexneri K-272]|nr:putative transposase [Shigella flexneri K-272]
MYQRLLKVDPLKCVLCGSQMAFYGAEAGLPSGRAGPDA